MLAGLGAALLASLLFGSVFVPIRKSPPTDGFAAQLFLCLGAFVVSVFVHVLQGVPPVYPLAAFGGALWTVANAFAIPIMNKLGMAVAILIWNSMSCLSGWATSRFGLFGVNAVHPNSIWLNYTGVVFLISGASLFLFVKSDLQSSESEDVENCKSPEEERKNPEVSTLQRAGYVLASIVSGVCYGSMCTPVTYIQHHPEAFDDAPTTGLPYIFSFYLGVIVTSAIIYTIYAVINREKEAIDNLLAIRSLLGGVFMGCGMSFFFLANQLLSPTIAYPLVAMAPGLVVSLWSVLYFREITGKRNLRFLCIAYSVTLFGVILVAVSKDFSF